MTTNRSQPPRPFLMGEPRLQDLLDDPMTHLLMESDGVGMDGFTDFLGQMRKRLIAESWARAA